LEALVGDQHSLNIESDRRAVHDVLHVSGRCVSIDPKLHAAHSSAAVAERLRESVEGVIVIVSARSPQSPDNDARAI
jgi:hypothetical protein